MKEPLTTQTPNRAIAQGARRCIEIIRQDMIPLTNVNSTSWNQMVTAAQLFNMIARDAEDAADALGEPR